jgi:hypothetical protein
MLRLGLGWCGQAWHGKVLTRRWKMVWVLVQGVLLDGGGPRPDNTLPMPQPPFPPTYPGGPPQINYPTFPSNPIVVPPGGAYPPWNPPRPGHDLPLFPSHWPVVPPGGAWPSPPIQPPQLPVDPGYGVDVGTGPVYPSHPIVLPKPPVNPPVDPVPPDPIPGWELKVGWTSVTGWIVVAVPTGEHVTPSK